MKLEDRIYTSEDVAGLLKKIQDQACIYNHFIEFNLSYKEAKKLFKQRIISWLQHANEEKVLGISKKSVEHHQAHVTMPYEGLLSPEQSQQIRTKLTEQAKKPLKDHLAHFDTIFLTYHMTKNESITQVSARLGISRETLSRKWNRIVKTKTL